MNSPYHIETPDAIFSPGPVLFREILEQNLAEMISMAGDVARLRPHCKTHKMATVVRRERELGITKHKAATFTEVEMLAECGVRDIVLSYNIVGPNIARAVAVRQRYPETFLAVTGDDEEAIRQLGGAMQAAGQSIGVLLDVNPGRDRTGLPVGDAAARLYSIIAETPGLSAEGFHLYDGHIQHQLPADRRAVMQEWESVAAFRDRLVREGLPVPRMIVGGTPTFPAFAEISDPAIELSPGTCVFHDANYGEKYPDLRAFEPALLMLTRVISRPTSNRVTFDLGTKAIAADSPMGQHLKLPELPDAVQVLQNEEHLVVETGQAARFRPGDWTLAIPAHVCPTVALHPAVTVIEKGQIVEEWPVTARDRG